MVPFDRVHVLNFLALNSIGQKHDTRIMESHTIEREGGGRPIFMNY